MTKLNYKVKFFHIFIVYIQVDFTIVTPDNTKALSSSFAILLAILHGIKLGYVAYTITTF